MIVHVEYRCPECEKVFNCPANLASHRRWHKPKNGVKANDESPLAVEEDDGGGGAYGCDVCGKKFRKMSKLRKHIQSHPTPPPPPPPSSTATPLNNNSKSYSIAELLSPNKKSESSKCPICLATFSTAAELAGHRAVSHGKPAAALDAPFRLSIAAAAAAALSAAR